MSEEIKEAEKKLKDSEAGIEKAAAEAVRAHEALAIEHKKAAEELKK